MPEFFLRPILRVLAETDAQATEKVYDILTPAGIQIRGWEGEPEKRKDYPLPKYVIKEAEKLKEGSSALDEAKGLKTFGIEIPPGGITDQITTPPQNVIKGPKRHYEKCPECGQETLEIRYDDPRHGGLDYFICHNPGCRGI